MSFSIISNEVIKICNTDDSTRSVAVALQKYIRQIDSLDAVRNMTAEISLVVDGKKAGVKTDSFVEGNIVSDIEMSMTEEGPVFVSNPTEDITPISIWKDEDEFNALVDQISDAKDISARINLFATLSLGADYGIDYWYDVFEDGPVEGVTCRLISRELESGIAYYCIGLSGDIIGEIPFDAKSEDVSGVKSWGADDILISVVPVENEGQINVEELKPFIKALEDSYYFELINLDQYEFVSNGSDSFSAEELSALMNPLNSLKQYSDEHNLSFSVDAYFYSTDGSMALTHLFSTEEQGIQLEFCVL